MADQPTRVIPVTHDEFEQFMHADTFMPNCIQLDSDGAPTCGGRCPQGYVCATFTYLDGEHGVEHLWYACAAPEVYAQLSERAILIDMARPSRRVAVEPHTVAA